MAISAAAAQAAAAGQQTGRTSPWFGASGSAAPPPAPLGGGGSSAGGPGGGGDLWLLDLFAQGSWTPKGTAKVLAERLLRLPDNQRPSWLEGIMPDRLEDSLVTVIIEAAEAGYAIGEHMDNEREKGRNFDDIYDGLKPLIEHVSTPMEQGIRDGEYVGGFSIHSFEGQEGAMGKGGVGGPGGAVSADAVASAVASSRAQPPPHLNLAAAPERLPFVDERPAASGRGLRVPPPSAARQASPAPAPPRRSRSSAAGGAGPGLGQSEEADEDAAAAAVAGPLCEAPAPDELEALDLEEPLMLVGSCNDWSAEEAARLHRLELLSAGASRQERTLRLEVPPRGVQFQLLSVARQWQWRLFPSKKGTLKFGEDRALAASLAAGPDAEDKAQGRDFRIKGSGVAEVVEVRLSIGLDGAGVRLWLSRPEASSGATSSGVKPSIG